MAGGEMAIQKITVQETVIRGTVIQETAVQGTVIQETAVRGTIIQETVIRGTIIQETAVQGTAIQRIAVGEMVEVSAMEVEDIMEDTMETDIEIEEIQGAVRKCSPLFNHICYMFYI